MMKKLYLIYEDFHEENSFIEWFIFHMWYEKDEKNNVSAKEYQQLLHDEWLNDSQDNWGMFLMKNLGF
jgi:hypothetical protein